MERQKITHAQHPDLSKAITGVYGIGVLLFEGSKNDYDGIVIFLQEWNLTNLEKPVGRTRTFGLITSGDEWRQAPQNLRNNFNSEEITLVVVIPPNATHFDFAVSSGNKTLIYNSNDLSQEQLMIHTTYRAMVSKSCRGAKEGEKVSRI